MIDIPPALQAKLDAGATTLARAWIVTRRDGAVFGFTDHDRTLTVAGVACAPDSGFVSGEMRGEAGAPARGALFGALQDDAVDPAELDAGLWDGARVEIWRVDWSAPELAFRTFTGEMGAVARGGGEYEVEVQGLTARLDRVIGRRFSSLCDAELGDARCGVDLTVSGFGAAVSVTAQPNAAAVVVSGAEAAAADWFTNGILTWTSGANAGRSQRIARHRAGGAGAVIELEAPPVVLVETGDAAQLVAGCDKRFSTCREKFSNHLNFRGCPHMPGDDVLMRHAGSEAVRDGSAR
ncbi:MAG: DUF2163 domain-containing protein [Oceanicaulis sp.]